MTTEKRSNEVADERSEVRTPAFWRVVRYEEGIRCYWTGKHWDLLPKYAQVLGEARAKDIAARMNSIAVKVYVSRRPSEVELAHQHAEAFHKRVDRSGGPDACWPLIQNVKYKWDKYGRVRLAKGRRTRAHRMAYLLAFGKIGQGLYVCHRCDNPACMNPSHLFLGTHKDNVIDRVKKQRCVVPRGKALDSEKVREIRALAARGERRIRIAEKLGIHPSTVGGVMRGKTWKTVAE